MMNPGKKERRLNKVVALILILSLIESTSPLVAEMIIPVIQKEIHKSTQVDQKVEPTKAIPATTKEVDPQSVESAPLVRSVQVYLVPEKSQEVKLQGFTLHFPQGAVKEAVTITLEALDLVQPMQPGMINVTSQARGFRALPHRTFEKFIQVEAAYDSSVLDSPKEIENLYTYFFNETSKTWERLERLGVDPRNQVVVSQTNHFTDFVNATLKSPETPKPLGFNPTSIKDIKGADPSSGIAKLQGLEPNNSGTANFSLGLNLPPGRGLASPQLALVYNSGQGSTWLGKGFDISTPQITIDTSLKGVPRYDGSETYLLNGKTLVDLGGGRYGERVEGSFTQIFRLGNSASDYSFVVKERNGLVHTYGSSDDSVNRSALGQPIYKWLLKKTVDADLNSIIYDYQPFDGYIYPKSIYYSGRDESKGRYIVNFALKTRSDNRIDARGGFTSKLSRIVDEITIMDGSNFIRKYVPGYGVNVFGQTELRSWTEADDNGNPLYKYEFDSFTMPTKGDGVDGFSAVDKFSGPGINSITSSTSLSAGGDGMVGFGFTGLNLSLVGLAGGVSFDNSFTTRTLLDVNGDGRPDEVWRDWWFGDVYYHLNTGNGFETTVRNLGIDRNWINNSTAFSTSVGGVVSFATGKTTDTTTDLQTSFVDLNGDGFVDFIPSKDGGNYLRSQNGSGGFETTGYHSVNPSPASLPEAELGDEVKKSFPFQDPVRRWSAPMTGVVKITGNINYLGNLGDGVKYWVYQGNTILANGVVDKSRPVGSISLPAVSVVPGDGIYFRIHSIDNVSEDRVEWIPTIEYTTLNPFENLKYYDGTYLPSWFSVDDYSTFLASIAGLPITEQAFLRSFYTAQTYTSNGDVVISGYNRNQPMESIPLAKLNRLRVDVVKHNIQALWLPQRIQRSVFRGIYDNLKIQGRSMELDALVNAYKNNPVTDAMELTSDGPVAVSKDTIKSILGNVYAPGWKVHPVGDGVVQKDVMGYYIPKTYLIPAQAAILGHPDDGLELGTLSPYGLLVENSNVDGNTLKRWLGLDRNGLPRIVEIRNGVLKEFRDGDSIWKISGDPMTKVISAEWPFATTSRAFQVQWGEDFTPSQVDAEVYLSWFALKMAKPITSDDFINRVRVVLPKALSDLYTLDIQTGNYSVDLTALSQGQQYVLLDALFTTTLPDFAFKNYRFNGSGAFVWDGANGFDVKAFFNAQKSWAYSNGIVVQKIYDTYQIQGELVSVQGRIQESVIRDQATESLHSLKTSIQYSIPTLDAHGGPATKEMYYHHFKGDEDFDLTNTIGNGAYEDSIGLSNPNPDPSKVKIEDPFAGGVFSWYYGEWNGCLEWNTAILGVLNKENPYMRSNPLSPKASSDEDPVLLNLSQGLSPSSPMWVGALSYIDKLEFETGTNTTKTIRSYYSPTVMKTQMSASRRGGNSFVKPVISGAGASGFAGNIRKGEDKGRTTSGSILTLSGTFNDSRSHGKYDFMDMNGDSRPDRVMVDDSGILTVVQNEGEGFGAQKNLPGYSENNLRASKNRSFGFGLGGLNILPKIGSSGKNEGVKNSSSEDTGPPELPTGESDGLSGGLGVGLTKNDIMDINGDGLPDEVRREGGTLTVWYNLGNKFSDPIQIPLSNSGTGYAYFGIGLSESGLSYNTSYNLGVSKSGGGSVGLVGGGGSVSMGITGNRVKVQFLDLNGDGLADLIEKNPDENFFLVKFNLGDSFSGPVKWYTPDWKAGDNFSIDTYGLDLVTKTFVRLLGAISVPGEYIPTLDLAPINNIIPDLKPFGAGDVISYNGGLSIGVSLGGHAWIPIPPINFVGAYTSANGNVGAASSGAELSMMDIDGDGLPDHVFKYGLDDFYRVKHNNLGKTGLLKTLKTPQGGTITLDYQKAGNTTDMPHSQWVLSQVTRNDGLSQIAGMTDRTYTQQYQYENGKYDRKEKKFLGFKTVTATQLVEKMDGSGEEGSQSVTQYLNEKIYEQGLVKESHQKYRDGSSWITSQITTNNYIPKGYIQIWNQLLETKTTFHDSGRIAEVSEEYSYDDTLGNVIKWSRSEGTEKKLTVNMDYQSPGSNHYILGLVSLVEIKDSQNKLVRKRRGVYNDQGHVISHKNYYQENRYLEVNYEYDPFGNLKTVRDYTGEVLNYKYDTVHHQYPAEVTDAFQVKSTATYNYKWGAVETQTDTAGQTMTYKYDDFGRLLKVFSPYDQTTPALEMKYPAIPTSYPLTAITHNKVSTSPGNDDIIRTVVMVDGFGGVLQTLKDADVAGASGMTISPWDTLDRLGRSVQKSAPGFRPGPSIDFDITGPSKPWFSKTEYDPKGRVKSITAADNTVTLKTYELVLVDSNKYWWKTSVQDSALNWTHSWQDLTEKVQRIDRIMKKDGSILTSRYTYDDLGQIIQAYDPGNNKTEVIYDLMGRKTALTNPDAGTSTWQYDENNGDLIITSNDRLAKLSQDIRYEYQNHRLLKTTYPDKLPTVYEYDSAGRIKTTNDSSGSTTVQYGKLGEVTNKTVTINRLRTPGQSEAYNFAYKANYLGQMEEITYPDGEVVKYHYNPGGQVNKITATKSNFATLTYVNAITYDTWGQRISMDLGNGTRTAYEYDANRRWLKATQTKNTRNENIQTIDYGFDSLGNVTKRYDTFEGGKTTQTYEYDDLSQLIIANGTYEDSRVAGLGRGSTYSQTYRFDNIGNMTYKKSSLVSSPSKVEDIALNYELTYTYDTLRPHQAVTIGERRYHYDLAGNMTTDEPKTYVAGSGQRIIQTQDLGNGKGKSSQAFGMVNATTTTGQSTMHWDSENRLLGFRSDTSSGQYNYNANGDRVDKNVAGAETLYPDESYQEYFHNSDRMQTKHIFLAEERLASVVSYPGDVGYQISHTYTYHSDHLGSASVVTDYQGKVYQRHIYMPYGETWVETITDQLDNLNYGFTGKEKDEESGWNFFGARYLDPRTSRWLSSDPALGEYMPTGDKDRDGKLPGMGGVFNQVNMNLYHYAGNNPIKFVDPDGRNTKAVELIVKTISGAITIIAGGQIAKQKVEDLWAPKPSILDNYLAIDSVKRAVDAALEKILMSPKVIDGLPPPDILPPVAGPTTVGPASRPKDAERGGKSLWGEDGSEWRWDVGDKWHNPHWDYNPHDREHSPWENIQHGDLPPVKDEFDSKKPADENPGD